MIRLKQLLSEGIGFNGVTLSTVPIKYNDPKKGLYYPNAKYSGFLKIVYNNKTYFYKVHVDTSLYSGPVLLQSVSVHQNKTDFNIITSENQSMKIEHDQMENITNQIKNSAPQSITPTKQLTLNKVA